MGFAHWSFQNNLSKGLKHFYTSLIWPLLCPDTIPDSEIPPAPMDGQNHSSLSSASPFLWQKNLQIFIWDQCYFNIFPIDTDGSTQPHCLNAMLCSSWTNRSFWVILNRFLHTNLSSFPMKSCGASTVSSTDVPVWRTSTLARFWASLLPYRH